MPGSILENTASFVFFVPFVVSYPLNSDHTQIIPQASEKLGWLP